MDFSINVKLLEAHPGGAGSNFGTLHGGVDSDTPQLARGEQNQCHQPYKHLEVPVIVWASELFPQRCRGLKRQNLQSFFPFIFLFTAAPTSKSPASNNRSMTSTTDADTASKKVRSSGTRSRGGCNTCKYVSCAHLIGSIYTTSLRWPPAIDLGHTQSNILRMKAL